MRRRERKTQTWWMGNVRSRDIGEKLRLVPFWERGLVKSSRHEVIIDPGPSFGAGDHPTTLMALELLEKALVAPRCSPGTPTMLDVGTGTGVLAIAGKILGTGLTVGLDIDAAAVYTARRNVTLNGLSAGPDGQDCVSLLHGSVDAVRCTFQVVAANLAAPTLLRLAPQLRDRTGRVLILSGIADEMVQEVLRTYRSTGAHLISQVQQDGWHAALFGVETPQNLL